MSNKFTIPEFNNKTLELRYENGIICIYGTSDGLKTLSKLLIELVNDPNQGHIHLEKKSLDILTESSEEGAIAIFDNQKS